MTLKSLWVFLGLLISLVKAVTVVDHHPDEEYIIEHEVSYKNAIEEAKKLKLYPGPIPGCKSCSAEEIMYCEGGGVVNDHCCCDNGPDDEVFRFVPHICRIGPEACEVKAGDCAEYTRLRECCCHAYHAEIWKGMANGASSTKTNNVNSIILIIFVTTFVKLFLKIEENETYTLI